MILLVSIPDCKGRDCLIFFNYIFERILIAFGLENFTCTCLFTQNFLKCKKNKIELESLIVYRKNMSLKTFPFSVLACHTTFVADKSFY